MDGCHGLVRGTRQPDDLRKPLVNRDSRQSGGVIRYSGSIIRAVPLTCFGKPPWTRSPVPAITSARIRLGTTRTASWVVERPARAWGLPGSLPELWVVRRMTFVKNRRAELGHAMARNRRRCSTHREGVAMSQSHLSPCPDPRVISGSSRACLRGPGRVVPN